MNMTTACSVFSGGSPGPAFSPVPHARSTELCRARGLSQAVNMLSAGEKAGPAFAQLSTTAAEQFTHCSSFSDSQFSKDYICYL